jgi:hypothetical protein
MERLSDLRRQLAPLLATSDEALRARMKSVHRLLRENAQPGDKDFGRGSYAPANSRNAMFLALAATLGGPPRTAGKRVERLWKARFQPWVTRPNNKVCPTSGAGTLGQALVALVEQEAVRAQLKLVEFAYNYEIVSLEWRDGSVSSFHPHTQRGWQARKEAVEEAGFARVGRLPAATFEKIARLLRAEDAV